MSGSNGASDDHNACKLKIIFPDALNDAAVSGKCSNLQLYTLARAVRTFLEGDVQVNEGVNNMIKKITGVATNIGMPLLDARIKLKKMIGQGVSRAGTTLRWKHRKPRVMAIMNETADYVFEARSVIENVKRYSPAPVAIFPPDATSNLSEPGKSKTWALGYSALFNKTAKKQLVDVCSEGNMLRMCFAPGLAEGGCIRMNDVAYVCYFRYYAQWTAARYHVTGIDDNGDLVMTLEKPLGTAQHPAQLC